ncbi:MAG: alcohol dehydrogenase catalytic domain-containing protein (plasmid) [Leptolyngbya sp. BL-A-14]
MMDAIRLHTYGAPEVLVYKKVLRPEPQPNEVLIQVHVAGVNAADWKIGQGYLQAKFSFPLPIILGYDVAGGVDTIGAAVTSYAPGGAVFAMLPVNQLGISTELIHWKQH